MRAKLKALLLTKNIAKIGLFLGLFGECVFVEASEKNPNQLAIGQGISSPSSTSNLISSENPVGLRDGEGGRVSGHYNFGEDKYKTKSSAYAGELAWTNGTVGIGAAYFKQDCDGCEGSQLAGAAFGFSDFSLGVSLSDLSYGKVYSVGMRIKSGEAHSLGLLVSMRTFDDFELKQTVLGAGYTYRASHLRASFDISRSLFEFEDGEPFAISRKPVYLLTPGLGLYSGDLDVSVSRRIYKKEKDPVDASDYEDGWYYGVGYGNQGRWHLAVYRDFINNWAMTGSLYI